MSGLRVLVSEPKRIAVFRALNLGDLICATPALRTVRDRFPAAEITLIGLPWASGLTPRLPWIDRFVPFSGYPGLPEIPYDERRAQKFFKDARECAYDVAVQMHGSGEISNGAVAALGGTLSIGYGPPGDARLDLALAWDSNEHEILRWLRLVQVLGCDRSNTQVALHLLPDDIEKGDRLLAELPDSSGPLVGVHPGASDSARRWPVERFADVASGLARAVGARIVITGTAQETELGKAIESRVEVPTLNLIGRTDLGSLAAVVARLDLLLSNDTGVSHVAATTRTRSVVLFGPTEPGRWAPLDRQRHVVIDASAVTGCVKQNSLSRLPVEPVLRACINQLKPAIEGKSSERRGVGAFV